MKFSYQARLAIYQFQNGTVKPKNFRNAIWSKNTSHVTSGRYNKRFAQPRLSNRDHEISEKSKQSLLKSTVERHFDEILTQLL